MAEAEDRALMRLFIARELETINEYEQFALRATSPTLKRFFEHVAQEEREHVAEGMHELLALDPAQRAPIDYHEAHGPSAAGAAPAPSVESAPVVTPASVAPTGERLLRGYSNLTIGGLRNRGPDK